MRAHDHRLRFAYSTINWGATCDIAQAIAEIRGVGWRAVELFGHALDHLGTPAGLNGALEGMTAASLFSSFTLPDVPSQRTMLQNRVRFASEVGAEAFGLAGADRVRWRPPVEEDYAAVATLCDGLAAYEASLGVTVSYHPHAGCTVETSEEIRTLMQRSGALRLCLDASHIALVGEDPLAVIDTWWDRLGYLHLKDWGNGTFTELGRGTLGIDFPRILGTLVDRRFAGWVVVEQSRSDGSPMESARNNAAYLTSLGFDIGNT